MPVRFPYFGISGEGAVLELEPEATDQDVAKTIATIVEVHLQGSTEQQAEEFVRHSMLPLVIGLTVKLLGEERAVDVIDGLPRWVREAIVFESARPLGPGH